MDYICKRCGEGCRSSRGAGKKFNLCERCNRIRQKDSFK